MSTNCNPSWNEIIDPGYASALVQGLVASVTEEEEEIDELCGAVMAKNWARSEQLAIALTKRRVVGNFTMNIAPGSGMLPQNTETGGS